ncbi:MAG: carbohydrate-binding family 9-like protein [Calditrichaeota bacterium]|nr:carbohydrate-binding family 9-like protein [Calditrichota bacterium]
MNRFFHLRNLFLLLIFCFPLVLFSQNSAQKLPQKFPVPQIEFNPRHYVCYRVQRPIVVDGDLRESSWRKANWTDYFVDIEGEKKPQPRFRTRAKMLWDERFFYFAAELEEPHIWAKLMQRDTVIFRDNDFEIFIDPDGDTHQYYEFEMNARNTVWDLLLIKPYRDGGPAVNGWDIHGLKSGVKIYGTLNDPSDRDEKWTLEVAMPWEALKECAHRSAPPHSGDIWRINFSRVEWQIEIKNGNYYKKINPTTERPFPEDNWVWSPQGLINMHYPEMWGFVQFSQVFVGKGEDAFVLPEDEIIKWQLRQIYYWQQNYRRERGHFSENLHELKAPFALFRENQMIFLKTSWDQFEFRLENEQTNCIWSIDQAGKVRKTILK